MSFCDASALARSRLVSDSRVPNPHRRTSPQCDRTWPFRRATLGYGTCTSPCSLYVTAVQSLRASTDQLLQCSSPFPRSRVTCLSLSTRQTINGVHWRGAFHFRAFSGPRNKGACISSLASLSSLYSHKKDKKETRACRVAQKMEKAKKPTCVCFCVSRSALARRLVRMSDSAYA